MMVDKCSLDELKDELKKTRCLCKNCHYINSSRQIAAKCKINENNYDTKKDLK